MFFDELEQSSPSEEAVSVEETSEESPEVSEDSMA